jgi:predicted RNA binding protein YcfA (HicA-like mRNA interferase family)
MKLPRDLPSEDLCRALKTLGYEVTRQTGSHMRLTTHLYGEHHVTVPRHGTLRVGTVAAVLSEVAAHFNTTRQELQERLFRN